MGVSLPNEDDRTAIVGSTGSGKTQLGIWLLSTRNYDQRPAYIFDFKGDSLIAELPAKIIPVRGGPPKAPGLYIIRPLPGADDAYVTDFLWKIWKQEGSILYIDEGYMVGRTNAAFNAILTQGRSKNIEVITLSQRPLWLSRFVFSEATYFSIFNLTDLEDRKTVSRFVPLEVYSPKTRLERFHSVWYDVAVGEGADFLPVPSRREILARFQAVSLPRHRVM